MAAESPSPFELPPPDPALDHFARLGLTRAHGLDREALESSYLERSRAVHPDRFAASDDVHRGRAMQHASLLNEAYATLRDPVRRAEYLVKLAGRDLDSTDPVRGAPTPSQMFLIDMIERREKLQEIGGDAEALGDLRDDVEDERDRTLDIAVEALGAGPQVANLEGAAAALVTHRYLSRFLEEIEAADA